MATSKQNQDFWARLYAAPYPLDEAIDYIRENMNVDDVFDEKVILEWVEGAGYKVTEE